MPPQQTINELENRVEDLENLVEDMTDIITDLEKKVIDQEEELYSHEHSPNIGDSQAQNTDIKLDSRKFINIGNFSRTSATADFPSSNFVYNNAVWGIGPQRTESFADTERANRFGNTQLTMQHQPTDLTGFSFFFAQRPPFYSFNVEVMQGNTITIEDLDFEKDELIGAQFRITNPNTGLNSYATITDNTKNTITLDSSPSVTTGTVLISNNVFLGSADFPWLRAYVREGTSGGVRFGTGGTGVDDNGLLYKDGQDLKYRRPNGTTVTIT